MALNYSKINTVNDGVLVCVDEAKDLYKYVKLEDVKIGSKTLKEVLKKQEIDINNLEERIKKLELYRSNSATLLDAIASEPGEDL